MFIKTEKPTKDSLWKQQEEIGEVAEQSEVFAMAERDTEEVQADLVKNLADVIHYTVAIAAVNGIDLEKVILGKDLNYTIKYNHTTNLVEFL